MECSEEEISLLRIDGIPSCTERKADLSPSLRTFHIKLENVDGIKLSSSPTAYHIQAVLFDQKYGTFVGNCWSGKSVQSETSRVDFNQDFYFYTSIPIKDLLLVIELITPSKVPKRHKACGWLCLPLLNSDEEDSEERNPMQYKVPLVRGSPLSLLPVQGLKKKKNKKKKKKDKSDPMVKTTGIEVSISQAPFPALLRIAHLIPENGLIDSGAELPGLVFSTSKRILDGSYLFKPQLQKCITFALERLRIRAFVALQEVEKEILNKFSLHLELAAKESDLPGVAKQPTLTLSKNVNVLQRRLQVSIHNGFCFIQEPDIYHLHMEPPVTPSNNKSLRRTSSVGTLSESREQGLVLRSDAKLCDIPDDPNIIILFLLEYVISQPSKNEEKQLKPSSLNKRPTANIAIVWGFCHLGTLKENPVQNISLTCDPSLSPHKILFLRTEQEYEMTFSAFSLLKQTNLSSSYQSEYHASAVNNSGSSESSKESYMPGILSHSAPKHKSVADIPMTIQQNEAGHSKMENSKIRNRNHDNNLALQEVQLVSSSLPLVPPLLHPFPLKPGDSYKTFSKLYWDKLQPVLDHHGKPATNIDSSVPYRIDKDLELHCPPQINECMMHCLAISGFDEFIEIPSDVFFTFQFYRFLSIRSESMSLKQLSENIDNSMPRSSLVFAFQKIHEKNTNFGFQVTYNIDPTELNDGEYRAFLHYLMKQNFHVDIWNGQSLLYFGTVSIPLKYFCRQGKEAVVSNLELDIFNCEYPDESLGQGNIPMKNSIGKLHIRLASIRHPLSTKALEKLDDREDSLNSVVICSRTEEPGKGVAPFVVCKARRLAETNRELSQLLSNRCVTNNTKNMSPDPHLTEERRRKLARMEAVRNLENLTSVVPPQSTNGMQFFFKERQRDLLSIESYIQKNKAEIIQSLLHKSVSSEKTIYPVVGNKVFFEFAIENPFQVTKKLEIIWTCPELCLVEDIKEWQKLRTINGISQKVEPLSFAFSGQDIPIIQLQASEKIHIPFTYQSLFIPTSQLDLFKAVSGHYFSAEVLSSVPALNSLDSLVKVQFITEDRTLLAVLNLKIQPLPPSFTHIFKFLSMEHSMFKKSIQIGRDGNDKDKVTSRCSHSEVVCSVQESQDWEANLNLHIKAPTRSAGKCTEFYVFIYKDKYQITPIQTWSVSVCPLQRIDLSCVAGQLMRSSLLIRGTYATNLVKCSSSSKELQLHPSEPFVLSPFAVEELSMNVRSLLPGIKYFQITLVNQALEQVLQSWLLVLSCQKPSVSKAFQVHLTIGKETAKRITYTNPYHQKRSFILHSSHPHLLQLREYQFSVEAGNCYCLGLYFMPQEFIFTETIFLYLNDASLDKNEETYCIKIVCQ